MAQIFSFDDFEQAAKHMQEAEAAANASSHPDQHAITYGNHWFAWYDEMQLAVFGEVFTQDEYLRRETAAGASAAEAKRSWKGVVDDHERGYRFGIAYSLVEPEGELGTTHVASMVPIDANQFLGAQEAEWDFARAMEVRDLWAVNIIRRAHRMQAELRAKAGE